MKVCKVVVTTKAIEEYRGQLLVFPVAHSRKKTPRCSAAVSRLVSEFFKLGDFSAKQDQTLLLYPAQTGSNKKIRARRVLLVGLGEIKKDMARSELLETMRSCGGTISAEANRIKATELCLVLPDYLKQQQENSVVPLVEGMVLGNYRFEKYKKKDEEEPDYHGLRTIRLLTDAAPGVARRAAAGARICAEAALTARDMANEPGSNWTPKQFAEFAAELAARSELRCRVMDKRQIQKAGMGGIIGVNQGSAVEPKLIILEHVPKRYSKTILLVGKGITFDSGGVSLKPAAGMEDMKYDMCGGAAVMSAMQAVAVEKPKVRVVAIVPATDNMSGSSAIKPGDIITHYNGVTSEVVNTDAEGRLILADALAYGIKQYKPDCAVDLATLTGAVIIGLGHHRTGLMSNNDKLAEALSKAGEDAGEKLWRLPLDPEYSKQIESDVADIKNIGGKGGGAITAAAYLQKFVGETPWAHLDIAGTAWDFTKKSYIPKGPSGIGVRTLLRFIDGWTKLKL